MMKNSYEILAPAGNYDTLVAAISAGADALYLGGQKFSARAKANNFTLDEIKRAVDYAHLHDKKIFVTINILIDDEELFETLEFVKNLYSLNVDALIVQDLGLAWIIKKEFPDFELHASTQMTINNYYGAKFLKKLGFKRVVLARETSLNELKLIKNNLDLEIETFIHGALCVSYSGQCLMSSMIGGKSGNRGECRGPCRKSYKLVSKNGKEISNRKYYLSTKDLNTLDTVGELLQNGAYSLKIEGRMKSPFYVYEIVSTYKKALDGKLREKDRQDTLQIFNRGFTKGLYKGDFGENFISPDRPDNRGVEIGEVLGKQNKSYLVKFYENIEEEDGLEFRGDTEYFGIKAGRSYEKNKEYRISVKKDIHFPSKINRTFSSSLHKKIESKMKDTPNFKRDINFKLIAKKGECAYLEGQSCGFKAAAFSDDYVENSRKAPLTPEKIYANLNKLGDSIFEIKNFQSEVEDDLFLKTSQLNKIRRDVTKALEEKIIHLDRKVIKPEIGFKDSYIKKKESIYVELSSIEHLKLIGDENANIIIRYYDLDKINLNNINYKNIFVKLEKIYDTEELESIKQKLNGLNIKGVFLNNLSQIEILSDFHFEKHADIGMNVFNSLNVEFLKHCGFSSVTLSPELNLSQIKEIVSKEDFNLNIIAYGKIPVMTMEHCPYALIKGCKSNNLCGTCPHNNYFLRDEKNIDFEVIRKGHITEILNSYPIFLDKELKELKGLNISKIIISDSFLKDVYSYYKLGYNKEDGEVLKNKIKEVNHSLTKGHIHRGIL